jgi:hypothetical protein
MNVLSNREWLLEVLLFVRGSDSHVEEWTGLSVQTRISDVFIAVTGNVLNVLRLTCQINGILQINGIVQINGIFQPPGDSSSYLSVFFSSFLAISFQWELTAAMKEILLKRSTSLLHVELRY